MTFISLIYGLFLLSVLGIYWLLGNRAKVTRTSNFANASLAQSSRLWVLIIASLIFYASLQIQYIPVLLGLILINFYLGKELGTNTAPGSHATNQRLSNEAWLVAQDIWNRRRLKLLWLGIVVNIIGLFSFKYVPFV